MKCLIYTTILLLLFSYSAFAKDKVLAVYADGITKLTLYSDNSFLLEHIDPIFPYNFQSFTNKGKWVQSGNKVILNPDKKKMPAIVDMVEKQTSADSIRIKVNYRVAWYDNGVFTKYEDYPFDMITVCINNKRKGYHHLVHKKHISRCLNQPNIKRQIVVDSTNTISLTKEQVQYLYVKTWGFDDFIKLTTNNPKSDYFEINITHPIDINRNLASKVVILKKKAALYYEHNGKVSKNIFINRLNKQKD